MKTTCGIFLVDPQRRVLIGHATNKPLDDHWSIPKGVCEEGELFTDAARRELKEETGIDLSEISGKEVPLGTVTYRHGKKKIFAFAYISDCEITQELKCSSMVHGGTENEFPEMDHLGFVDYEIALDKLHYTQQSLLKLLGDKWNSIL